MDRAEMNELKRFIEQTVEATITKTLRKHNEKWLSREQLMEQFQMFTPSWMKTYGYLLPQQEAMVIDKDGILRHSREAYPMYQIQEMIMTGKIKDLSCLANPRPTRNRTQTYLS